MQLYTSSLCPFAHRVRLVLAEKGLEMPQVEVDPRQKRVPALEVDGRELMESAVISEYLDEIFVEPALMPRPPLLRAAARQWIHFADERLYPHTRGLLYAATESERPRLRTEIREDLRIMEAHLASQPGRYWMGDDFTLVDATFFPWFEQRCAIEAFRGFVWPEVFVALEQWRARVAARPAVSAISKPQDFYLNTYGVMAVAREIR